MHDPGALQRVVLGVHRDEAVGDLGVLQRAAQQLSVFHGHAVVAEAHGADAGELVHLGEPLAGQADAHGGEEAGRHARFGARLAGEALEHGRRVDHGVGVGHAEDGDVAAGRGRRRGRDEVFFVFAARRAQVGVQVDEAGQQQLALAVDDAHAGGRRKALADGRDAPLAHQHVDHLVESGKRVDGAGAAHEDLGAGARFAPRAHRHAAPLSSVVRSS